MKHKVQVLKFGGSCFIDASDYDDVAELIQKKLKNEAERLIVVVSALSGTTGNLKALGLKINKKIKPELMDNLLATGEMVSAALLCAALEKYGLSTMNINAFQTGITASSNYTRGNIEEINPQNIKQALNDFQVVVVAGGQAVTSENRLVMLGRNSSDLTAVVLAAYFKLSCCELYSDVCGIYSSDPYTVNNAFLLQQVPFDMCINMSTHGAKVIYHQAVNYAKKKNIKIVCKKLQDKKVIQGTVIGSGIATPVVIPAKKAYVFEWMNNLSKESLVTELNNSQIINISTEKYIIIIDDIFDIFDIINRLNIKICYQPDLALVTTINHSKDPDKKILRKSLVDSYTISRHKKIYGLGLDSSDHKIAKSRSCFSHILGRG